MMKAHSKLAQALICSALLLASGTPALADSIFDFSNNSDFTPLPLTLVNNGLAATFTGRASICVTDDPEVLFGTLQGQAVIQDFCNYDDGESGPLGISFSQNLSALSFNFATSRTPALLTVDMFEDGVAVGSQTFLPTFPSVYVSGNPEGFASVSGVFNSVVLSSASVLAYDNVDAALSPVSAVPEPSTLVYCLTGTALFATLMHRPKRRYATP